MFSSFLFSLLSGRGNLLSSVPLSLCRIGLCSHLALCRQRLAQLRVKVPLSEPAPSHSTPMSVTKTLERQGPWCGGKEEIVFIVKGPIDVFWLSVTSLLSSFLSVSWIRPMCRREDPSSKSPGHRKLLWYLELWHLELRWPWGPVSPSSALISQQRQWWGAGEDCPTVAQCVPPPLWSLPLRARQQRGTVSPSSS